MRRLPWAYRSREAKVQTRVRPKYPHDVKANQDDRQLLAVCGDVVRLYPPSDAVNAPQSLAADETYSVIAWLLFQNQVIAEDAVLDAETLPKVQMPNRNGFIPDPRPDVR